MELRALLKAVGIVLAVTALTCLAGYTAVAAYARLRGGNVSARPARYLALLTFIAAVLLASSDLTDAVVRALLHH